MSTLNAYSVEIQLSDALAAQELFRDFSRLMLSEDEIEQTSSNGYELREDLQEDFDAINEIWNEWLLMLEENNISIY